MSAEQTTGRVWNRRRTEKQRRLTEAKVSGKVIPTDQLVAVLEQLLAPGDRVVLEGNNQKQADFLSRMLAAPPYSWEAAVQLQQSLLRQLKR